MKLKWIGPSVMGIGVLHTLVGFAFAGGVLLDMFADGFFNSVTGDMTREAAFWFFMFGFLLIAYGQLAVWISKQGQLVPALFGWGLLVICLIGIVAMPASGFWLGLIPATAVLWGNYRGHPIQSEYA